MVFNPFSFFECFGRFVKKSQTILTEEFKYKLKIQNKIQISNYKLINKNSGRGEHQEGQSDTKDQAPPQRAREHQGASEN
jgi:hypothetical protein